MNELIISLSQEKIDFFKKMIEEKIDVTEIKIRIENFIIETHQKKTKTIDDLMNRHECLIDNFPASKDTKKEVEKILQEYFLVKHISTFLKIGYTPPSNNLSKD